jgi:hypothetical protein
VRTMLLMWVLKRSTKYPTREVLRFRCLLKIAISKHRSARRVLQRRCLLKVSAWVRVARGDTDGDSSTTRRHNQQSSDK